MAKQIIYTDGSALGNGKKMAIGGYSVIFTKGPITAKAIVGAINNTTYKATNIRAEGQAIIEAIKASAEIPNVVIYTDSKFWIDMIYKYMPNWHKKKIDFATKANPDLTTELWQLWSVKTNSIELIHVYAHNKSGLKNSKNKEDIVKYNGNELADKLANLAAKKGGAQEWIDL